jgi:hypothetical protein
MKKTLQLTVVLFVLSCDGGLQLPPLVDPGFGGTITFERNTWPPSDSLVNLWLVASKIYPLDSVSVFAGIFSDPPQVFAYPGLDKNLPFFVDSVQYSFALPPGAYRYVAVLQRFRDELNIRSFRVVGVYSSQAKPAEPLTVTVRDFEHVAGINLHVNFHQLPPQPF